MLWFASLFLLSAHGATRLWSPDYGEGPCVWVGQPLCSQAVLKNNNNNPRRAGGLGPAPVCGVAAAL